MIQKETWISFTDKSNAEWGQVFHLYKGFFRKKSSISFFFKGSIKKIIPPKEIYKGFKLKFFIKGNIFRGLIINTKYNFLQNDLFKVNMNINNCILIKKKQTPVSKHFLGPILKKINRKKIILLFKVII